MKHWSAAAALVWGVLLSGCRLSDPTLEAARQEHLTALRGAETMMPLEEQIAHVTRAITLDPGGVSYLETRAGYYISSGDLAAAQADLDRAIVIHDRPYLRFSRGAVRCERDDLAPALDDLDRAIAAQPRNTQFYLPRAIVRVRTGRAAEALEDAATMIEQAPQHADGYYARGVALAALGRWREAEQDLSKVVRDRPELSHVLPVRARVYEQLDERVKADADIAEAARRQPWSHTAICVDPRRAARVSP